MFEIGQWEGPQLPVLHKVASRPAHASQIGFLLVPVLRDG